MKRGLILDLDNTVYNWVAGFLPSFRAMVHKLAAELRLGEEEILDDFRQVYKRHGTVEYPRAVEELAVWEREHICSEEKQRIVELVRKVFSITLKRKLCLFPHVKNVLEWARNEGIVIIGLSDALERWVSFRLRNLGVEKYFSGLYTWHYEPWFDDREPAVSSIRVRFPLVSSELKPNEGVVNRVVSDFSLDREGTYMVGDSLAKDVTAAQAAGVNDVWARYGTHHSERNLDTLRHITPWAESEKSAEKRARGQIVPTFVIDDFSELINLVGSSQPKLFD